MKNPVFIALLFLFQVAVCNRTNAQAFCVLVCNAEFQVAVPPGGSTELLPSMISEGDPAVNCPGGSFKTQAMIGNNWQPASGNYVFTSSQIGQTVIVRLYEINTANACWANVTVVEGTAGLFELSQTNPLELFPNPADQYFILKAPTDAAMLEVRLADVSGIEVLQQNIANGDRVDISMLPKGIYTVTARTSTGVLFSGRISKHK